MVIALLWVVLAGCGPEDDCPEGSMLAGEDGLIVVQNEHPEGWGEPACFSCHAAAVVHRTGCTPGVDLSAVREEVDAGGLSSCAACHGNNGVSP